MDASTSTSTSTTFSMARQHEYVAITMNENSRLLSEKSWSTVISDMRPEYVERAVRAKDRKSLRIAACQFAELALAQCDSPDSRALNAVSIARLYSDGKATIDELNAASQTAELAAREAIAEAERIPSDSIDVAERVSRILADTRARAYTAALATTLTNEIAALAWSASEAQFALTTRALAAEVKTVAKIMESVQ